nr:PRD domain-containing protein [Entomospira entomophilus]
MQEILDYLTTKHHVEADNSALFLTHLSMAIMRQINNDTAIDPLDEHLYQQIRESEDFDKAQRIWSDLATKSFIPIPDHELGYIYMHLVALLNQSS